MELVYLWVEDYKNIKGEGFNFSPNYECEFTPVYEDDKLSDKSELKVNLKDNPLKDFFGKNINVTAIVGENGSGKSTILEILLEIFSEGHNKALYDYIFVYKYDEKLYSSSSIKFNDSSHIFEELYVFSQNEVLLNHSDIITVYLNNEKRKKTFLNEKELFSEQLFIENTQEEDISLVFLDNLLKDKEKCLESCKDFFLPKTIRIYIKGSIYNPYKILTEDLDFYDGDSASHIKSEINKFDDYTFYEKLINIEKLFKYKYENNKAENKNFFQADLRKSSWDFYKYNINKIFIENIPDCIFQSKNKSDSFEISIDELDMKLYKFLENLPYIFNIELVDDEKSLNTLSYGERQLLLQLNLILNFIGKTTYTRFNPESKDVNGELIHEEHTSSHEVNNCIVIIDEYELGLHPQWQKKVLNLILDYLKNFKQSFHLIINSHSPFLLSDIPKQNVVFLQKDEQTGKCINSANTVNINPFGANIHTLLSHGFFMKDGLMGEFAKSKIDDVIEKLNTNGTLNNEDNKYCQNIINIIGEPILKRQLQKMINDKIELTNKDEIELIKDEMKRLHNRLNELEDD